MPELSVEETILDLKAAFGAETDEQLAKALGIGRSTVASWRLRGSVPKRYSLRKPGEDRSAVSYPPRSWGEEENAAFKLAFIRFVKENGPSFSTYRAYIEEGLWATSKFWIMMSRAKRDVVARMDETGESAHHAGLLLAYREYPEG